MLGWEILVYCPNAPNIIIARWTTSAFGLSWLDQLVKYKKATDLGGNGYPNKYAVRAGVLLPIIKAGLSANDNPIVIGDDYVLPEGWSDEINWDQQEVLACRDSDQLIVEAWDQS